MKTRAVIADQIRAAATGLTFDGDTVEIHGGRRVRISIVPDECATPQDIADVWGGDALVWVDANRDGHMARPSTMDGGAEILDRGRLGGYWWQPHHRRDTPGYFTERINVMDLINYGPCGVSVILERRCECGTWRTVAEASVWGLEPVVGMDPDYLADVVADLVAEVAEQVTA